MKRSVILSVTMLLVMLMTAFNLSAQNPVQWNASVKMTSKTEGVITLTAKIEKGWHVYGFNQSPDGPESTVVKMSASKNVTFKSKLKYKPAPISIMDEMFGTQVTYWENSVTLTRKFKVSGNEAATATVEIYYMACNDSNCQPPKTETFTLKLK